MRRNQAAGVWERMTVTDVAGQVAGIVGYGDVGHAVAHRAKALGMTVLGSWQALSKGSLMLVTWALLVFPQAAAPPGGRVVDPSGAAVGRGT